METAFVFLGILLLSVAKCCHGNLCESALHGCWCYDTNDGVRAECSGDTITHIPVDLPFNLTELLVRDAPINILLARNLSIYTSLKSLQLLDNTNLWQIQSQALAGIPNLESVEFARNNISSIPNDIFSASTSLQNIDMRENSIPSLPDLPLPNLETLVVYYNRITIIHSNAFTQCSSLIRLDLNHNEIKELPDNVFAALNSLTDLTLDDNSITSISQGKLYGLTALSLLTMSQNKLESLPNNVFSGSPSLAILDVSKNGINTVDYSAFQGLSSLETLNINDNWLSTVPSQSLQLLSSLKTLYIEANPIESFSANAFRNLPQLTGLFLGQTNLLVGIDPDAFNDIPNLSTLSLIQCPNLLNLTLNELPNTLNKLSVLHIRGNGFTHLSEETFASKASLQTLNLQDNPFHCSCVLQWMARVVEDDVLWAAHWRSSSTPPRCRTPDLLEEYKIPFMKETDFTCDAPVIEPVSPGKQYVHMKETIEFVARLHKGLPSSEWLAPDGEKFVPMRRPPGEGLSEDVFNEHRFAMEAIDPEDHAMIATLRLNNASLSDAGGYRLQVENYVGEDDVSFELEVYPYELTTPIWTEDPNSTAAPVEKISSVMLVLALAILYL